MAKLIKKKSKIQDTFGDKVLELITTIILLILLVIVAYPVIYVVSASFSSSAALTSGRVLLWPVEPTVSAYKIVFGMKDIINGYKNTIFYTVVGTIMQMIMQIKKRLKELLPAYMIPQKIVFVDAIPKNANGKVDRKLLKQMASLDK
mgnify:CR=1 FL=1